MPATDFGDPSQILHVPERDLRGTREEKLAELDLLLTQLQLVRLVLCGRLDGTDARADDQQRTDASPALQTGRIVRVLLLFLIAVGFGVAPAGAQSPEDDPTAPLPTETAEKATSDDAWRAVEFGVTLESFYQYNWNRPPDRSIPLRAYDSRTNTFAVQQAAFIADLPPDVSAGRRFGMRADLQFGMATETVQGNPANEPRPEAYRNLWQAYGSYVFPLGRGVQTDVGKFASNLGFETNYAKDNNHFSRAYLFNFLPFYHSGLRVTYPVSDELTVMYMLTNGIQQTEDFNDFKSTHLTAIVTPLPALTWTVNGTPIEVGPGQALCIPRGAIHRFDNNGGQDVKALCVITPAAIGPQFFHEAADVFAAAAGGPPDRARLMEILRRHGLTPAPPQA